jgi:hypothetical protein
VVRDGYIDDYSWWSANRSPSIGGVVPAKCKYSNIQVSQMDEVFPRLVVKELLFRCPYEKVSSIQVENPLSGIQFINSLVIVWS